MSNYILETKTKYSGKFAKVNPNNDYIKLLLPIVLAFKYLKNSVRSCLYIEKN